MKKLLLISSACLLMTFNFSASIDDVASDGSTGSVEYARSVINIDSKYDLIANTFTDMKEIAIVDEENPKEITFSCDFEMKNFLYSLDLSDVVEELATLVTSEDKGGLCKGKILEWQQNLQENKNKPGLFKTQEYMLFMKLFSEIFLTKKNVEELSHYDAVNYDINIYYPIKSNSCLECLSNTWNLIASMTDKITSIKELVIDGAFARGKFKYQLTDGGYEIISLNDASTDEPKESGSEGSGDESPKKDVDPKEEQHSDEGSGDQSGQQPEEEK